jgi:hypothetical protein
MCVVIGIGQISGTPVLQGLAPRRTNGPAFQPDHSQTTLPLNKKAAKSF